MRSSTFLLFSGSNISAETPITDLQPFIKPFGGKDWIWCSYPHLNAKSMKMPPEIDKSFQPVGTTLSEMTFSLFLSLLHREGNYSINKIPRDRFLHIIQAVVEINPSSFIVSDGESLLAYCGGSDTETLYTQRVYTQFQGLLYTGGDYENKLQSDASHAWVELYLPNIGWLGFDPTNNIIVNQDHIRVACGRNYLDATPTSGTIYKGGYGETLYVDVKVTEV